MAWLNENHDHAPPTRSRPQSSLPAHPLELGGGDGGDGPVRRAAVPPDDDGGGGGKIDQRFDDRAVRGPFSRLVRILFNHADLGGDPFGLVIGQSAEPISAVAAPGPGAAALESFVAGHLRRIVSRVDLEAGFPALGTTAVVLIDGDDGENADDAGEVIGVAVAAVRREVDQIDRTCSRFRPDSELMALNAAGGGVFSASATLFDAVSQARRAAELTDGLVDPTMGRDLRRLGYDCDFSVVPPVGPPLVVTVRRGPDWTSVRLDAARRTITLPPGLELDLGATAKAWCADRAARAAFEATGAGVLVGLGGDIAVAGPAPADGWSVRVTDDHAADPGAPGEMVLLTVGGLATSSTTVRHWTRGDEHLHHLLDPTTGRPATVWWRTVSVAAASCLDANIATTAAILLGPDAPGWLADRGLPARLVRLDGTVRTVAGWPAADDGGPEDRRSSC